MRLVFAHIILTLMKGDELIELSKIPADEFLLVKIGNIKFEAHHDLCIKFCPSTTD